jgi:acyl-CoA thioesterase YciA
MNFMVPVKVGAIVSCYSAIGSIGRSSIEVNIEVWVSYTDNQEQTKVTEGVFVFVAIDQNGRTRQIT